MRSRKEVACGRVTELGDGYTAKLPVREITCKGTTHCFATDPCFDRTMSLTLLHDSRFEAPGAAENRAKHQSCSAIGLAGGCETQYVSNRLRTR